MQPAARTCRINCLKCFPAGHRRNPLRGFFRALLAGALILLSAPAVASPLFELAGAVQGEGGLAARAVPAGAASAYFNPAFLPDTDEEAELGVFVLGDQIGIALRARPPGADIPVASVDMQRPGGARYARYGLPTQWLEQGKPATPPDQPLRARPRQGAGSGHHLRGYQVLGFVVKALDGRLGAGFYGLIPYGGFTGAAAFYPDEREQYFSNSLHPELYADRLTAASLALGLGARLHERLSVGLSFTLGLHAGAVTPTYVEDVGRFRDILLDAHVDAGVAVAPHAAVVLRPTSRTRVALTAHSPQKAETEAGFSFLLANGLEQAASARFVQAYVPWSFALGAAHDFGADGRLGVV